MALSSHVGNFTQPTTTNASFAVTGVGFTPKVLILFASDRTSSGTSANVAHYMGFATSTSNRVAISQVYNSGTTGQDRAHDDSKCFIVLSTAGSSLVAADLVSFDADGFTLNFSTVDSTARLIGYIALGGSDLTNAFIKSFLPPGATGNQSITGVGFKPDAIFFLSAGVGGAPPSNNTGVCNIIFGFTDGTNQKALFYNTVKQSQQVSKVIAKAAAILATLTSFDSDGFTLNYTAIEAKYNFALCLKGGKYKVGVFNQATSTGNQSVTGVGFQPTGVILASINQTASSSLLATASRISFGAASDSASRMSIWSGGNTTDVTSDNNTDTGKVLNMITEGASPTTNTSADFVSNDSDGFTINNTSADATAREIVYMAFGSTAIASTSVKMQAIRGWSFPV